MAIDQYSNTKPLTVIQAPPDDDAGWKFVGADLTNTNILVNDWQVASGSWQQILNGVGSGSLMIPQSDTTHDEILSNATDDRKAILVRAYMDDVFRYAFFAEDRKLRHTDDGGHLIRYHGKGMESIADGMTVRAFDHPASPSQQTTWVYGSNENLLLNAALDDDPVLENPSGADGNDADGQVLGWAIRGDVTTAESVNIPAQAYTGDHYIEVKTASHHSGIEQTIPCSPNRVYHVRAYVNEPGNNAQRYTLNLSGADDIAKTATYTNNFKYKSQIMAELDNVARNVLGNGCPGGASDGTYQVLDVEVTTGANQDSLTIAVQHDHHPGCGDLDGSYPLFRVGLVEVDGFGLDLEPWEAYAVTKHATDSFTRETATTPPGADYSIRINPLSQYAGIEQHEVQVNQNAKYTLYGRAHISSITAGDTMKLEAVRTDGTFITQVVGTLVAGSWIEIEAPIETTTEESFTYRFVYEGPNNPTPIHLGAFAVVPGEPAATPGKIMNDLLTPIQARGTFDYLQLNYSDTEDSDGQLWFANVSIDINSGVSIRQVLDRFVALGYDWMIAPVNYQSGGESGFELSIWNSRDLDPTSGAGIDWTGNPEGAVVTPGEGVTDGGMRDQIRRPNVVYVEGKDGAWSEVMQEPFDETAYPEGYEATIGRIEASISVSDVTDTETLNQFGKAFLADEKHRESGFKLKFTRTAFLRPYRDFGVGDALFVDLPPKRPDPDHETPRRVRAIQVTAAGEGTQVLYDVDFSRVTHTDEASVYALIAQLAERSPVEITGSGSGSVNAAGSSTVVISGGTVHSHTLSSLTSKALSGDVSGQVDGNITVNRIRGVDVRIEDVTDLDVLVYSDDETAFIAQQQSDLRTYATVFLLGGM